MALKKYRFRESNDYYYDGKEVDKIHDRLVKEIQRLIKVRERLAGYYRISSAVDKEKNEIVGLKRASKALQEVGIIK